MRAHVCRTETTTTDLKSKLTETKESQNALTRKANEMKESQNALTRKANEMKESQNALTRKANETKESQNALIRKASEMKESQSTLTRKATVVLDKEAEFKPPSASDDALTYRKVSSMTVTSQKSETPNGPKVNPNLTHELNCLMQQFSIMSKNKTMIFNIVNQLQNSYKKMMKKNLEQEREIRFLKEQNRNLGGEKECDGGSLELRRLKSTLQSCEVKLGTLETNMRRILMKNPATNQMAIVEMENQKLIRTNSLLKFHLKQALLGLEKYKNVAFNVEHMYNRLHEKCKRYTKMLRNKNKDTNELITSTINQMKNSTFQQLSELEKMKHKYEHVLNQQKTLERKWKLFEENDIKKLEEAVIQHGRGLENELQKVSTVLNGTLSKDFLLSEFDTSASEESGSKEEPSRLKNQVSICTLESNQTNSSKVINSDQVPTTEAMQTNNEDLKFCTTIDEDYELECEFETCEE